MHIAHYDGVAGPQSRQRESHRNAMITVAVHLPASDRAPADAHAVRRAARVDPQPTQAGGHHLEAVALLEAQLSGALHPCFTVGTGCRHKQRGEFIDRERHELGRQRNAAQPGAPHREIRYRLGARLAAPGDLDAPSHQAQAGQ